MSKKNHFFKIANYKKLFKIYRYNKINNLWNLKDQNALNAQNNLREVANKELNSYQILKYKNIWNNYVIICKKTNYFNFGLM